MARIPILIASAVASIAACHSHPREGTHCRPTDRLACVAKDLALVCDSGSWRAVPCKGPQACVARADIEDCDDTIALEGDQCPREPPFDYACTPERSEALVCQDGRFELWRHCRGTLGCAIASERRLHCDTTLGEVADPCEKQGTYACSVDRKTMLQCDGRELLVASACRGAGGCHFDRDSHKVDCDDAIAFEGDPCDRPRRITCGADGKSELVCTGNKYVKKRDCRRTDCHVDGSELFCD